MHTSRDVRVHTLQRCRHRSRPLAQQVASMPRALHLHCDVCGEGPTSLVALRDRYAIGVQAFMCMQCGLVYLADRLTVDAYSEFYRSFYRPLVSRFWQRSITPSTMQSGQRDYARQMVEFVRPWIGSGKGQTLLDIGGSTGTVAQCFADALGYTPTVLDPAADELRVAQTRGLRTIDGFFETHDFAGEQFDCVLLCQTIEHLHNLPAALTCLATLVRPGGVFFCDIVDFAQACHETGCVEASLHIDHCYNFTSDTAEWMFAQWGWRIIATDVASRPGHIGYLLTRGSAHVERPKGLPERLQTWVGMQAQWRQAGRHSYSVVDAVRVRAYRLRKRLLSN